MHSYILSKWNTQEDYFQNLRSKKENEDPKPIPSRTALLLLKLFGRHGGLSERMNIRHDIFQRIIDHPVPLQKPFLDKHLANDCHFKCGATTGRC